MFRYDDHDPTTAATTSENQVRALVLAASGVEGWAEQHILDLLGSDLVYPNVVRRGQVSPRCLVGSVCLVGDEGRDEVTHAASRGC